MLYCRWNERKTQRIIIVIRILPCNIFYLNSQPIRDHFWTKVDHQLTMVPIELHRYHDNTLEYKICLI